MIDYNAELAVIGSMLIEEECAKAMLAKLRLSDFGGDYAQKAFGIMAQLAADGKPIDAVIVAGQAENPQAMGDYLLKAMETTVTVTNADEYAAIVKRNACIRQINAIGDKLSYSGADFKVEAIESVEALQSVIENASDDEIVGAEEWADAFKTEEEQIIADPEAAFCPTGLSDLDHLLGGGMFNGGLYVLGARPGMGKTTVALNIAERVAKHGQPVLYISLEMSPRQIMCKRIAAEQNIPYRGLMSGRLSWDEQIEMDEGLQNLKKRPFHVNKRFGLTVSDIAAMARRVRGCKLVVVDYFGLISVEGDGKGRYEDYTAISGRLKQLACQLDIPILCLAQLNREAEKRSNKKPTLSDLRDTGAIEQDADGVLFLHRDGYYREGTKPESENIDVILAKNRHGETGTVSMWWQGSFGRVSQFDTRREEPEKAIHMEEIDIL